MIGLNGKVAIITGGGRGIGRAHALALAEAGAAVVVNDVGVEFSGDGATSIAPAQQVVEEIIAAGGQAIADATDISDWDAAAAVVDAAVSAFGGLDIVVNNAGITRGAPIEKATRKDWERTIGVNLTGTGAVCHWAAVYWRSKGPAAGRRLINTTSNMGLMPHPNDSMYSASKAGIAALTIVWAMELAELGVRVNGIAPIARSRISESVATDLMRLPSSGFDRMSPDHAATLVTYLASSACAFTGRIFGVIGDDITLFEGWTINRYIHNGETKWPLEELAAAMATLPAVQDGQTQGLKGMAPNQTPAQSVLDVLAAIERA